MENKTTTRLFFALWPDQATRKQLADVQNNFSNRPGRCNHPEDFHITLVFLGSVETERMSCIIDAADRVSLQPFSLSIDRFATWKKPRILWCGPSITPLPLTQLVTDLENALTGCGFEPETRRYSPHVTLARKVLAEERGQLAQPLHWRVGGFVLAGSGGQGPGPRYKVLKKWSPDS